MRNMSFALTTSQFKQQTKDVTRRNGWLHLKAGDRVMGVLKAMGLRPGEKITRLGEIEIVDVRRERLDAITAEDCIREGFPEMRPADFVAMYCEHNDTKPDSLVTRIEFRHVGPR